MSNETRQWDWVSVVFLTATPVLALAGGIWHVRAYGLHPVEIALFFVFYVFTGLSITAGYHRLFAHRSYDCHPAVKAFFLIFGAAAIENSVLRWARDHRIHHQKVDTAEDPYNIRRGLFYAHMGWIFYKNSDARDFKCAPDLARDPMVVWQDKYYLPILVTVGFALPTAIGAAFGRPLGGFLWGGLIRAVLVQHMTFFINSLAHYFGSQPYSIDNTARDSWWLAFLTYGEGYHNFHHRFAADYRNGHRWYHFDPSKWTINALSRVGLASRLTRYREEHILRARIETDLKRIEQRLAAQPAELSQKLWDRLESAREQLEAACAAFQEAKIGYRDLKRSMLANSRAARRQWRESVRLKSFELQAAQARWALLIAALGRMHGTHIA
ncbi:MAG TPA: fatty acid desaturase [Elusimicrobiota bacterium]|nr:fatty acid desaturase [Elusimicrobiota bacterium]